MQNIIPLINQTAGIKPLIIDYLNALKSAGFTGDIETSYAGRLTMATDNSIYQMLPSAVIFPRSTSDVCMLARIAERTEFLSITFTPRGGGTGTNGQSLNDGIVVDMSRFMNRILDFNKEEGWVKVEAGVVKDQLNQFLKPHGYFFSPELSTSNRATLGGMINTDACGQGSLVYGKTSDHVLALRAILLGGDILDTQSMSTEQAQMLATDNSQSATIYRIVLERCAKQRELILKRFPKLNRFLTGYDLRHVYSDDMSQFDLTRILTGSEGTLAFITEAKLNITPLPKVRRLINIKYDSFDSALRSAPLMLEANALSVETIDSKVFNLARQDIIWDSVKELITDVVGHDMQGINIVEYAGNDNQKIDHEITELCQRLDQLMMQRQAGIIGYQVCNDLTDIERIYAMRKKAVGLLGNASGDAKPIPFAEDTCVPPSHLADYITEFRALLDQHNLAYGMFGHVDAGVLHVRPALDMCDPEQEKLMKTLSDEIVALTAKYGGLLWGEHGKGFRAEYSPAFFGEVLYNELRCIKAAFDPHNRLNPGKICTPLNVDDEMLKVDALKRGTYDRQIPIHVRHSFRGAMECNGNGLCFNFDVNSPMCPSMKISADRIHSPKGRAGLVREWLRLLSQQGVDPIVLEKQLVEKRLSWYTVFQRTYNTFKALHGEYDFSHQVKQALSGCLSCKACSSQCPIKIDVPTFKARFLQLYHGRYLRPLRDHIVASVERYTPLMAKAPAVFNFFLKQPVMQKLVNKTVGLTDLPLLSAPNLKQQLAGHRAFSMTLEQLEALPTQQRSRYVLIVQDPFTSYYDAKIVADFVRLIEKLNFIPVLLPFLPNGKAQHIKGFLRQFAKTALKAADMLNRLSQLSIPLVGVDPAIVLSYRDEYKEILAEKRGNFNVLLIQEWLYSQLDAIPKSNAIVKPIYYLLGHCTESTAVPVHIKHWQAIFQRVGSQLEMIKVGCCGMAGTYGHEQQHLINSHRIYQLSWQKALHARNIDYCLTTGYSCRSQVKRFDGIRLKHPLQALLTLLENK